jgi:hypothetical protein
VQSLEMIYRLITDVREIEIQVVHSPGDDAAHRWFPIITAPTRIEVSTALFTPVAAVLILRSGV